MIGQGGQIWRATRQQRCLLVKPVVCLAIAALNIAALNFGFNHPAAAQLISDDTLGTERSRVTGDASLDITGEIRGDLIEGGARRGSNLFHSFSEFNVGQGQRVYFSNPAGIENIISRVTGGRLSRIEGTLGVLGNANLFLLNPSGIVLGANARLDLRGSFIGSTANSLVLADGTPFSAVNPQLNPVLTVSVPIGLQYGGIPGSILVTTRRSEQSGITGGLTVDPGRTLALIGGSIDLINGSLAAPDGRIELGSVATEGFVSLNSIAQGFDFDYSSVENFSDIRLTQGSIVGGTDQASREIQIQGNRLRLSENSQISTVTATSNPGGNLTVNASEAVELMGSTTGDASEFTALVTDSLSLRPNAGNAGNITIATGNLTISGAAQITSFTSGSGTGGNIVIRASETIRLAGGVAGLPAGITTGTRSEAGNAGRAGNIRVETRDLGLRDGAQIFSATFGAGDAGDVLVNARREIEVTGSRQIARSSNSADLTARLPGADPRRTSVLSLIAAQSQGAGEGGDLTLSTRRLLLQDSGQISTTAFAEGNAGNIDVQAIDFIRLGGTRSPDRFSASGIFAQVDVGAAGNGGNLRINTGQLTLENGTRISVGTIEDSTGNGGNLTLFADSINLSGSNLFLLSRRSQPRRIATALSSESRGNGRAGNLTVRTPGELTIQNGAEVSVRALGQDVQAGNLTVRAGAISLDNGARVVAETESGNGGNIALQGQNNLLLRDRSRISTTAGRAGAGGSGGNINIAANFVIAPPNENSDITANAFLDRGGTVEITAQDILGISAVSLRELESRLETTNPTDLNPENLSTSDVTAISQSGNPQLSGQIIFNTPDVDPSRGLAELPIEVVDASQLIGQSCTPTGRPIARRRGEFVVTGRSGLPDRPDAFLQDRSGVANWITLDPNAEPQTIEPPHGDRPLTVQNSTPQDAETERTETERAETERTETERTEILEAQGWTVNPAGEVVLVAHLPDAILQGVPQDVPQGVSQDILRGSQAILNPCSPELSQTTP